MNNFESMGLPESLNIALQNMKFEIPTPIQAQVIPLALEGKDIIGAAQTGTGKTAAFGIPLVTHLILNPTSTALVITPTRELAAQVMTQLQTMLVKQPSIKTALLIGGNPIINQIRQLRRQPRLVVGTPGRINDFLQRKNLILDNADFLVLDETDRMLDMGFSIQIEDIIKFMPTSRQTLLFSATLPKKIIRIAEKYLNDFTHISVNTKSALAENIKQDVLRISESEKYPQLLSQLETRNGSIIIFLKTRLGTEKIATRLYKDGLSVNAIHGNLRQGKRDRVIADFRKKKYRILVATDIAARGLDIPHIEHVINYDLPQCSEDYIHRIGRTARAGATGSALCLITPSDRNKWREIENLLNPDQQQEPMPKQSRSRSRRPRNNGNSDRSSSYKRSGYKYSKAKKSSSSSFGRSNRHS